MQFLVETIITLQQQAWSVEHLKYLPVQRLSLLVGNRPMGCIHVRRNNRGESRLERQAIRQGGTIVEKDYRRALQQELRTRRSQRFS